MSETKKPVFSQKAGVIEVSAWENKGKTSNGQETTFLTVDFNRNYKDGEEWKKTKSLRVNDLPVLQTLLQKVFEFAKLKDAEE